MSKWETILEQNDNEYESVIATLESLIATSPKLSDNYYHLGLAYLLLDQSDKAETVWNLGLSNTNESKEFISSLVNTLKYEAIRQKELRNFQVAFNICQAIRNLLPHDFENLVQIFYLSLHLNLVNSSTIQDLNLLNIISSAFADANSEYNDRLMQLLQNVCASNLSEDQKIEFISFAKDYVVDKEDLSDFIVFAAQKFTMASAFRLLDIGRQISPNNCSLLTAYNHFLFADKQFARAINDAREYLATTENNLLHRLVGNHILLASLLGSGGKWEDVQLAFENHQVLVSEVLQQGATDIPQGPLCFFLLSAFMSTYLCDNPKSSRSIQNQISRLFQANLEAYSSSAVKTFCEHQLSRKSTICDLKNKKIKIGFLSNTLRQHSVGWLARFLIDYLDRNSFELYGYLPGYIEGQDFLQEWYVSKMHKVFRPQKEYTGSHLKIADEIDRDQIDILIDLESITAAGCCQIMAQKPAPIQITWLGWDASGLPAIDYYIADPYVLPAHAQDYYSEKIWRLPHTYLAIDGFESTVPTITRAGLDIPENAVIYFSSQKSDKRHPETVKLQMEILRQVPNSYFLIKGLGSEEAIKEYFYEIAKAHDVSSSQLRFLSGTKNESEHRGNLSIADVVLDTYPYTGATTTMEVLWAGIPLVTRVGEQFVSRNSYAMMMNAGISEGIAWTPEEYVQWGVRFGIEPDLRRDVAWKLRQSRKTSPLWNTRQFAREFETALKEIWEIHNG